MKLYYSDNFCKLYNGNMLDMIESGHIKPMSIDCIVTDPPYELNFMNKGWDNAGVSFSKETWKKCFDVLKPGGYLLAFGGSRTFHRIACAIEDAGFEIRDTIMWIFGSGFPKSMNIGLAIDKKNGVESEIVGYAESTMPDFIDAGKKNSQNKVGFNDGESANRKQIPIYNINNEWKGWGTCLKPAFEPIIIARKPFDGSLVDNVLKYGVGGLNIDECRVPMSSEDYCMIDAKSSKNPTSNYQKNEAKKYGDYALDIAVPPNENGRFPANLILTYDESDYDEVCGGFPFTKSTGGSGEASKINNFSNVYNGGWGHDKDCAHLGGLGDEGSASRYFYCAKASKKDRNDGLNFFDAKVDCDRNPDCYSADVPFNRSSNARKNNHPTVKPTSLMQYIIRLVAPKGATVLDPFMGSGSTGKACVFENRERDADYKFIGIELTDEYLPIAEARIKWAENIEFDEDASTTDPQKEVVEEENIEPVFEKFDWGI